MKLSKGKKNELIEINQEFLTETQKGIETLYNAVKQFIADKLNKNDLEKVIETEHKCDLLKEKYVQVLFRDKRALPFLVEDRYQILMKLDQVNDKAEFFARFLEVYPFKLFDDIKESFQELCNFCYETVKQLLNCATLIETDFDGAYKLTFEIEAIRRKARKAKFELLDILYKKKDNPTQVYLTSKLVTYIYEIASWAEETSDYLRGLIIKYPTR
jgi:predicted phosphate transport protein (TIGR00153 family)